MCSAKLVKCTQVVLSVYEVNVVRAWCAVCSVQPGCLCSVQVIVCGQHSLFSKGACAVCRHLRCVFLSSSSRLPTLLQPHCALLLLNTTTKTVFGSKHIFFFHWTKPPGPSPPPAFTAWASYPTSQSTSPSSQPPPPSSQPLPPPSLSELHCPISKAQKNSTTTRCALEAESAPFEGVVDETIAARNHSPGGGADRDGRRKQKWEKKVFKKSMNRCKKSWQADKSPPKVDLGHHRPQSLASISINPNHQLPGAAPQQDGSNFLNYLLNATNLGRTSLQKEFYSITTESAIF